MILKTNFPLQNPNNQQNECHRQTKVILELIDLFENRNIFVMTPLYVLRCTSKLILQVPGDPYVLLSWLNLARAYTIYSISSWTWVVYIIHIFRGFLLLFADSTIWISTNPIVWSCCLNDSIWYECQLELLFSV